MRGHVRARHIPVVETTVTEERSLEGLGATWRGLEAETPDLSFFRSWTWVGCLAEERFPHPVVLKGWRDGRLVGLALFNRRDGALHLGESGDPALNFEIGRDGKVSIVHVGTAPVLQYVEGCA